MDELNEILEEIRKALRRADLKNLAPKALGAGLLLFLALLGFACVYTVNPDEVGVVQRFGEYVRSEEPGLRFKLPPPIERVTKVRTEHVLKEEFGFRRESAERPIPLEEESIMLTGDLNTVDVQWVVQYKIETPSDFLFKVRLPKKIIRDLSEATMREAVGDRSIDEVLTFGRLELASSMQTRLQELLNFYETGLRVVTVQLQDVNPPGPVRPSFNEVNEARQEKEKVINQAQEQYNKVIPQARGQADKIVGEAEAYATERVNIAEGEAGRFLEVWKEYRRAPEVTRRRLYLETMEEILPTIDRKVVLDPSLKQIMPLMDLRGGSQ